MKNILYGILLLNVLTSCNIASEQPFYYQEPVESIALAGKWLIKDTKEDKTEVVEIKRIGDFYEISFMGSGEDKDLDIKLRLFRINKHLLADVAMKGKDSEDSETGHFLLKINPKGKDKMQLLEAYFKQDITQEMDGLSYKKEGMKEGMITLQASSAEINAWLRRKLKTSMQFKEVFEMNRQ